MIEQFNDNEDPATEIPDPENLEEARKTETPEIIPILPLRGTVVFPMTLVPLAAGQSRSLRLIDDVVSGDRIVGLVLQHDQEQEGAGPGETFEVGVVANIHQMMRVPDGTVRLAIQGVRRMRVLEWVAEEPYLTARIEEIPEEADESVEVKALMRNTLELFQRLVSLV
jgi:ATP-dependent Lon protease